MTTHDTVDLIFKALSDPTRRAILESLRGRRLAVTEVATNHPEMSRPAVSKHLRILREAGLVSEVQQGRQRLYGLVGGGLEAALAWLGSAGAEGRGRRAPDRATARSAKRLAGASETSRDWQVW